MAYVHAYATSFAACPKNVREAGRSLPKSLTCMVFVLVFVVVLGYLHQLLLQGCLIYISPSIPPPLVLGERLELEA